jgi:2-polyprenyl-3-methyl-5-hydroxy-6-metoxy-1,4-benzoquinol methylase
MKEIIRKLSQKHLENNQPSAWFEELYTLANQNPEKIPWALLQPNPYLQKWLRQNDVKVSSQKAVVVGCGLGDDAEALQKQGYEVTAFDISPTAINWCRQRFPDSSVNYQTADVFNLLSHWRQAFDLVWECRTIQALPVNVREKVISSIVSLLKPDGTLLMVTNIRDTEEVSESPPWPLSEAELNYFTTLGLKEKNRSSSLSTNVLWLELILGISD